jgi:hypothetical protein
MSKIRIKANNIPSETTTSHLISEGGVFHVTSINKNGDMTATYEYVDDIHSQDKTSKNLYIDFNCLKTHPRSKYWVEYPSSWAIDTSKTYEIAYGVRNLANNQAREIILTVDGTLAFIFIDTKYTIHKSIDANNILTIPNKYLDSTYSFLLTGKYDIK